MACGDGIFVQSLRFSFSRFWVYTGYVGNLRNITPKLCNVRKAKRKKERNTGRCIPKETGPSFLRQYLYSYIPVHERVIMKDWFIRMPFLGTLLLSDEADGKDKYVYSISLHQPFLRSAATNMLRMDRLTNCWIDHQANHDLLSVSICP